MEGMRDRASAHVWGTGFSSCDARPALWTKGFSPCVANEIVVGMRDRASAPNSGAESRVSGDSSLGAYKAHDVRRSACIIGEIDVGAASRRHFLHTLLKHESWHGHSQIADLP